MLTSKALCPRLDGGKSGIEVGFRVPVAMDRRASLGRQGVAGGPKVKVVTPTLGGPPGGSNAQLAIARLQQFSRKSNFSGRFHNSKRAPDLNQRSLPRLSVRNECR